MTVDATFIQMIRAECAIIATLHHPSAHRNQMERLSAIRANPTGKAERCEMLITDAFAVAAQGFPQFAVHASDTIGGCHEP